MKCENYYCVYWFEDTCILNEISLDIQGNCRECILVDVEESVLKKARDKYIDKLK